jgi:hypothetical protein
VIFDGTVLTFFPFWMLYDCLNLEIVSSTFSSLLGKYGYRYRTKETVIHILAKLKIHRACIRCLTRLFQNYLKTKTEVRHLETHVATGRCTVYRMF